MKSHLRIVDSESNHMYEDNSLKSFSDHVNILMKEHATPIFERAFGTEEYEDALDLLYELHADSVLSCVSWDDFIDELTEDINEDHFLSEEEEKPQCISLLKNVNQPYMKKEEFKLAFFIQGLVDGRETYELVG